MFGFLDESRASYSKGVRMMRMQTLVSVRSSFMTASNTKFGGFVYCRRI